MRVYISGKIGEEVLSDATRQKFAKAEEMLMSKGFAVFNPTTSGLGLQADRMVELERFRVIAGKEEDYHRICWYEAILRLDLEALSHCHAIYMLDDWKASPGARVERELALATRKKFFFQDQMESYGYLENMLKESWSKGQPLMLPDEGEDDWDCTLRFQKKHIHEVWLPLEKYESTRKVVRGDWL